MAKKKKTPSQRKHSNEYWLRIAAAQSKIRHTVESNIARDEWESQHQYRKFNEGD